MTLLIIGKNKCTSVLASLEQACCNGIIKNPNLNLLYKVILAGISFYVIQFSLLFILNILIKKRKKVSLPVGNPDLKFPFSFPQHLPVPEVPGGVGPGAAGRLCAGVQV